METSKWYKSVTVAHCVYLPSIFGVWQSNGVI